MEGGKKFTIMTTMLLELGANNSLNWIEDNTKMSESDPTIYSSNLTVDFIQRVT